jgi:hypothetical protein
MRAGDGRLAYLPGCLYFLGLREPVDSGTTILRNVGNDLRVDMLQHTRRFDSPATPLSEPQNIGGYVCRNNAVQTASLNKSSINEPCLSQAHTRAMYRSLSATPFVADSNRNAAWQKGLRLKRISYRQKISSNPGSG